MFLRIDDGLSIDNLNDYPVEVVSQLETLLESGVEARLDPKRKNFYDVEASGRGFFIHVFAAQRQCNAAGDMADGIASGRTRRRNVAAGGARPWESSWPASRASPRHASLLASLVVPHRAGPDPRRHRESTRPYASPARVDEQGWP